MNTLFIAQSCGSDISSRVRGAQLRRVIAEQAELGLVTIDFTGVRTISESFADELFGVLVEERSEEWFRSHVKVANLLPLVRTTILEAVANRLQEPA